MTKFIAAIVVASSLTFVAACGEKAPETPPAPATPPAPPTPPTPPPAAAATPAATAADVTAENADATADALAKEIESDTE